MFVILWEFEVKPGSEQRFETVYSPSGEWAALFQRDPRYRGTRLLRDSSQSLHYYTLDFWDSESAYREFLSRNEVSYSALDSASAVLTVRERRVVAGPFENVA